MPEAILAKYIAYIDLLDQYNNVGLGVEDKHILDSLVRELHSVDKSYALEITGHGFYEMARDLFKYSRDNEVMYKTILQAENPSHCLLWWPRMTTFILGLLAQSRQDKTFYPSKKTQFTYNKVIASWSIPENDQYLLFSGIVETGKDTEPGKRLVYGKLVTCYCNLYSSEKIQEELSKGKE